jgi:hypothetical protein
MGKIRDDGGARRREGCFERASERASDEKRDKRRKEGMREREYL